MDMQIVWRVIAGLILSGFVFALPGCATGVWIETPVRNLPVEVTEQICIGDTREKVRSILGDPLIDARNLGVEAYQRSGRDIDYVVIIYPFPDFGEKVTVSILVVYDESDRVKEIATDFCTPPCGYSGACAGGFHFVTSYGEPETLLGNSLSWEEMAVSRVHEGKCSLILLMGECPMEKVSIDGNIIANLSPLGRYCVIDDGLGNNHNCDEMFIQKDISPGSHRLAIHQETMVKDRNFETNFECVIGETVYAELETVSTHDRWWGWRLEGKIVISKRPNANVVTTGNLCPILWHRGTWYGESINPPEGDQ